jgi:hypothetical protein
MLAPSAQAAVKDEISILNEYSFSREAVGFTVSNTCSGHSSFNQVSVREDGWFATYTQMTGDGTEQLEGMFSRVYIDIFDSNGKLQKEITFAYSGNVAIELLSDTIDIYIKEVLLSYNWETDELLSWKIPENALTNSGLYLKMHKDHFQQGEWTYRCHRTTYGYAKLTRENDTRSEILLSYTGNGTRLGNQFVSPIVTGGIAAGLIVLFGFLRKRRKRKDRGAP